MASGLAGGLGSAEPGDGPGFEPRNGGLARKALVTGLGGGVRQCTHGVTWGHTGAHP